MTPPINQLAAAAAWSAHVDGKFAAEQASAECAIRLGPGAVDLAMVYYTASHLPDAAHIADRVRRSLNARCLIGMSVESIVGGVTEIERSAGLSVIAMRLPGVSIRSFTADGLAGVDVSADDATTRIGDAFGANPDLRATILLVDPFSVPLVNLLPAMCGARVDGVGHIVGGMASASRQAGGNLLHLNDRIFSTGAVGVSLSGPLRIDAFVSQGCRPIGDTYVITGAQRNLITHLGGRPVVDVLHTVIEGLSDHDRALLQSGGLLLGRVVTEYKDRFGQGDYLIRNVMNVNPQMGAMGVADLVRVGQTVCFHLRDAQTAHDDLAMMLDAQKLHEDPFAALVITCNGRGVNLFPEPSHDAAAVAQAFAPSPPGEQSAKAGAEIDVSRAPMPIAGFFGAGEIGPVGKDSYVHGHSVVVSLFRSPSGPDVHPEDDV